MGHWDFNSSQKAGEQSPPYARTIQRSMRTWSFRSAAGGEPAPAVRTRLKSRFYKGHRFTQKAAGENDPVLQFIAESVERLTEELRDNTMSIRMVPIGTLFSRFRRLVHDLAGELGKQVQIVTGGRGHRTGQDRDRPAQ